jgi:hypothetical protein
MEVKLYVFLTLTQGGSERLVSQTDFNTLIIKDKMHYFSTLFRKELYMFRTHLLSIIRSLNTVFTATGIRHTSYVACPS